MAAVDPKAVADLGGQLPGGGEHERTNGSGFADVFGGQLVENGQRKSRRFPGPCLSHTQHVATGEQGRNGFCLHGGRYGVPFILERLQKAVVQLQF